jgi:c-di-GMP phosphodiesterase
MKDHPVLAQVSLGYSPMIDRQRAVIATRLTVFPERPDSVPDAQALLRAIEEVWPSQNTPAAEPEDSELGTLSFNPRPLESAAASGTANASTTATTNANSARAKRAAPPLCLNLAGEGLLRAVMAAAPGANYMLEVPAFMAADPAHAGALRRLHDSGTVLLIKGRPLTPLAPELLALFTHAIVDAGDDRRAAGAAPGAARSVTCVQTGAHNTADVDAAFQRGAVALLGWPWDDSPIAATGRSTVPSDVTTVMELIQGVDREDPVHKLEAILKRDPTLGFRLMRYLNSAAFGLRVELNSFGHALMMLGYQRLKRWLALLLASSVKGANAKPVMFAAVRRGLLMEELGRDQGDSEMHAELFICGVFSLLDRMLQQPLSELLANVPVPERVQQALLSGGEPAGPFGPYLALVQAIEQESLFDIREQAETMLLSPARVNRALMVALHGARQLDG